MKQIGLAVAVILCFGVLLSYGQEAETVRPAYQFKENQKLKYDLELVYDWDPMLILSDNRGAAGQIQDATTYKYRTQFLQGIRGLEADQATFNIKYTKLKQITKKGKEIYIPGTKAAKNRELVYTINSRGQLELVEEWESFTPLSGGIEFGGDLKDFLFRFYPEFPDEALKVGSTWSREIKGSDFNSQEDLAVNYKILGFEKFQNHRCIKIEVKGTILSDFRADDPRGMYFAQFKSQGTIDGICYFAHLKGLLAGFEGQSDKGTEVTIEWVRGDDTGRKQVKQLRTRIQHDLKLSTGGS